jgi:hypothetical protein
MKLDAGCWILDTRYLMDAVILDTGYWILDGCSDTRY